MTIYPLKVALDGMWREKWINLLSMLTIATGLFIIAFASLLVINAEKAIGKLPERFSVAVFLADGVGETEAGEITAKVKRHGAVQDVRYISSDDALKELREGMKDAAYILEGLNENPLPASLEVKLKESAVTGESVRAFAETIKGIEGVADVEYGSSVLSVIQNAKENADALGFTLVLLLSAGIMFVCYSTVKILLYRKNDEIETLKLLGATKWFIRAPFLLEGGILGLGGGAVCSLGLLTIYRFVFTRMIEAVPLLKAASAPPLLVTFIPVAGLLIGILGAFAALGRIRY